MKSLLCLAVLGLGGGGGYYWFFGSKIDAATGLPKDLAENVAADIREPLAEGMRLLADLDAKKSTFAARAEFIRQQIKEAHDRGSSQAAQQQEQELQMVLGKLQALREQWNRLKDAVSLLQTRYVASTTCGNGSHVQESLGNVHQRIQISREALKRAETQGD